jgi:ankyrin repeat protein
MTGEGVLTLSRATYGMVEAVQRRTGIAIPMLHAAASVGSVTDVKLILARGAPVDVRDNSTTPLHAAALSGHVDVCALLLDAGADIHAVDAQDRCALHYAVVYDKVPVLKLLLARGSKLSPVEKGGLTPLATAVCEGRTQSMCALLEAGESPHAMIMGTSLLYMAARCGHAHACQVLIERFGVDVSAMGKLGVTPMHGAAIGGCPDAVKLLVAHGADIHAPDSRGFPPIFHTMYAPNATAVIDVMLAHGADVNARVYDGFNLLHLAAQSGAAHLIPFLVARGCDVNAVNVQGITPLMNAVLAGATLAAAALVCAGANVNAVTPREGSTALMAAAVRCDEDMCRLLLRARADASIRNAEGLTAAECARAYSTRTARPRPAACACGCHSIFPVTCGDTPSPCVNASSHGADVSSHCAHSSGPQAHRDAAICVGS